MEEADPIGGIDVCKRFLKRDANKCVAKRYSDDETYTGRSERQRESANPAGSQLEFCWGFQTTGTTVKSRAGSLFGVGTWVTHVPGHR